MTKDIGVKPKPGWRKWKDANLTQAQFREDARVLWRTALWLLNRGKPIFQKKRYGRELFDLDGDSDQISPNAASPPRNPMRGALRPSMIVLLILGVLLIGAFFNWGVSSGNRVALIIAFIGLVFLKWRQARSYLSPGSNTRRRNQSKPASREDRIEDDLRRLKGKMHDERHKAAERTVLQKARDKRSSTEIKKGTRTIGAPDRQKSKVKNKSDVIDWD